MNTINDIIRLISTKELSKSDIIGMKRYNSKAEKLYYDIKQGLIIENDTQLSKYLFGDDTKLKNTRKFKNRFKSKLINTLLVIGNKNNIDSELQSIYHNTNKYWVAGNLLEAKGAKKASIDLFKVVYKNSSNYEFSELGYLSCSKLAGFYGVIEENVDKQSKYELLQKKYFRQMAAENEVEQLYSKLKALQSKDKTSQKKEVYLAAKNAYKSIQSSLDDYDSFKFKRFAYLCIIIYLELITDHKRIIEICDEAIYFFNNKNMELKNTIFSFDLKKFLIYIQNKNFKLGLNLKSKYEIIFTKNEYNWFVIKYYFFILSLHSKKYNDAYQNINEVIGNKRYSQLPVTVQENFNVFNAYSQFLIKREKILQTLLSNSWSNFRLGRFLNEVPHFSKDKRGLNISILILQVLFLLHDKKYSKIIDRTDALNQYCYRYLRKDETFRSNCFIKMLIQMVKADFNRIRTERYVEPIWKKLQEVPIHVAEQGIEVEIIPYEDLWPMVLEMLDS